MATKIQNPNTVSEWVSELHRVGAMTGTFYKAEENRKAARALADCQRRCADWLRANPDVKADFLRSQSWAQ